MSFTRKEYVATYRAAFDYGSGVHKHIDNPDVAEIWVGLTVPEREDLACLFALAEALRRLGEDQNGAASRKTRSANANAWRSGARPTPPER